MSKQVTTNRLADLLVLAVGYDQFLSLGGMSKEQTRHADKGFAIIRRFHDQLHQGMEEHLKEPALKLRQKTRFNRMVRITSPAQGIGAKGEFLAWFLPKFSVRQTMVREIFDGRSLKVIKAVSASVLEDPSVALNRLAQLTPVSGLQLGRKWLEKAAEISGNPISDLEIISNDVAQATDLAQDIRATDARISTLDPGDPEVASLREKKADLIERVEVTSSRSIDPATVQSAAVNELARTDNRGYLTETGKKMGLTPEQEQGLIATGRSILAAGAGSGKTRVLASKVVYHINELGVPATSIMATSFTAKSSAELIQRIEKYGAAIEGEAKKGFGTTHSVAGRLNKIEGSNKTHPLAHARGITRKEGWKTSILIRLAMEQVKLGGARQDPPAPTGLWEGIYTGEEAPPEPEPQGPQEPHIEEYQDAIRTAGRFLDWAWRMTQPPPEGRSYSMGYLGGSRGIGRSLDLLKDEFDTDPVDLSDAKKRAMNSLFSKLRSNKKPIITYRIASQEVLVASIQTIQAAKKKNPLKGLEKFTYSTRPAGQWFNIENPLVNEEMGSDGKVVKTPIPTGEFKRAISKWKGKGVSPSEVWAESKGDPAAAVYGAYEWLKGRNGEPEFQGLGDFDDVLIDAVRVLLGDPGKLKRVQAQYKVLLIDEAQDLNRVQHILFGLIAGYYDPETLEANEDQTMTADTFQLIGDDKQAIYSFRGADPDEFIRKSDLTEGGDDFPTTLITTNFRSGEQIVNTANKLIANNDRQIPMVCQSSPPKGEGAVVADMYPDTGSAAEGVAEEVEELMETTDMTYKDFGIGVRTNVEAYDYGLAFLKRGIPFKSNARFFTDRAAKAVIAWVTIAEVGIGGVSDKFNQALLGAVDFPTSYIGKKFKSELPRKGKGNWYEWLRDGGDYAIYPDTVRDNSGYRRNVQKFLDKVEFVAGFSGEPITIMDQVLELKGASGDSIQDSMVAALREDNEKMAELIAESPDGRIDEGAVAELAMAPLDPLRSLLNSEPDLESAMNFVRRLQKINQKISSKDQGEEINRDAVTISTMHGWKGLEVSHMYVPMRGGKFPHPLAEIEDERRLAYVAITRAENKCTILNIPTQIKDKIVTSQFIEEACIPDSRSIRASGKTVSRLLTSTKRRNASQLSAEELEAIATDDMEFFTRQADQQKLLDLWGTDNLGSGE